MFQRLRNRVAVCDKWLAHRLVTPQFAIRDAKHQVALTFDDGPDPIYTTAVLDTLAGRSVEATFFLVGDRVQKYPRIVERIMAEGHSVGSHTRSHPDMWTIPFSEVRRQYADGRKRLEDTVGHEVTLVRPPKGWLDLRAAVILRQMGFRPVLWSASGDDWQVGATTESILESIGTPDEGAIVLLHDAIECPLDASVLDRTATVEALGPLIDRMRGTGSEFVKLN